MATAFVGGGGDDAERRAAAVAMMPRPDGVVIGATVEDEHNVLLALQRAKEHALQQQRVCSNTHTQRTDSHSSCLMCTGAGGRDTTVQSRA